LHSTHFCKNIPNLNRIEPAIFEIVPYLTFFRDYLFPTLLRPVTWKGCQRRRKVL
jgi:hypothetical protein